MSVSYYLKFHLLPPQIPPQVRVSGVKSKNFLTKNITSNQLFSKLFSKTVTFTKFCQKCVRGNFRNFHTVRVWKNEKFSLT